MFHLVILYSKEYGLNKSIYSYV